MNLKETLMILADLKVAYPHSFKDMQGADFQAMSLLWQKQFSSIPYMAVDAAMQALISTRTVGYSPTIGEVKEQLLNFSTSQELTDQDAWALVSKACSNGIHHSQEEFDKLPEDVQRAVGGPEQLKAWARMDEETVQSVIASNFKKTFRVSQERKKQLSMVAPEVRAVLSDLCKTMSLPGSNAKQIGKTKAPQLMPVKPEPMVPCPKSIADSIQKPQKKESYTPPDPGEWERRREEAMRRLTEIQTERNDSHDNRKVQSNGPDLGQHTGASASAAEAAVPVSLL